MPDLKLNAIYIPFSLTTCYKNSAAIHLYDKQIQEKSTVS